MTLPFIFATQAGNVPASELDADLNAVGAMAITACAAAGTNAISLAPAANQPTVAAYANYQAFGFVAPATPTGTVTLQVNGLGFLPVYDSSGNTLVAGSLLINQYYVAIYNSALNTGSGGFQLISSNISGSLSVPMVQTGTAAANNTATYADVSGLNFNLVSGATYQLSITGSIIAGSDGGGKLGTSGSATFTSFSTVSNYSGGNALLAFTASSYGAVLAAGTIHSVAGGVYYFINITGKLVVNAGGNFQIQFAQVSADGNTTNLDIIVNLIRIS